MKMIKEKDFKIVTASTLEEFEEKMHEALIGLDNPKIKFPKGYQLTAYISWKVPKQIAESLFEKVVEKTGARCFCGDCPHFERNPDRRKHTHYCKLQDRPKLYDNRACDDMLKLVLDGTLKWRE